MPYPIVDKLKGRVEKKPTAFHMPGHKGKKEFIPFDLFSFDITEIDGFDNLHNPSGIIDESRKLCAEIFGADETFYLVNGSTSGIMAAVYALCGDGDKILVGRNCHKSVYSGIILSGAKPVYITPEKTFFNTFGVVSKEAVEEAILKNPDIKAAIFTSPSYEGFCMDIKSVSDILHKKDIPLIIDEAHGAHFKFSVEFPETALSLGADIAVQSIHKTLPALTQCSLLHLKNGLIDMKKVRDAVSMFTSTSPSYIFMAAMDNCQNLLSKKADELFKEYVSNLKIFYERVKKLKKLKILSKHLVFGEIPVFDMDFGKIVCIVDNKNINYVEKILKKYYNINIEMKGTSHILFMTSVCDSKEDFKLLGDALFDIDGRISSPLFEDTSLSFNFPSPICPLTPKEAFNAEREKVSFKDSMGLISAEFIIPYPPGIPLLVPGELITPRIIELAETYIEAGIELIGCEDSSLFEINIAVASYNSF